MAINKKIQCNTNKTEQPDITKYRKVESHITKIWNPHVGQLTSETSFK